MIDILKIIVGSQAHGLATPQSDYDYRGVFVVPTEEILKIGNKKKNTSWIEGKVDDTSWELEHFLMMATKSNPTILETFLAPVEYINEDGEELRALFDKVWSSRGVRDAFVGYGLNQRKKFLDDKDGRRDKYAAAYARTLVNAYELLTTGTFTVRIADLEVGVQIRRFKDGDYTTGELIEFSERMMKKVDEAYEKNPDKETDMDAINAFLIKMRKKYL